MHGRHQSFRRWHPRGVFGKLDRLSEGRFAALAAAPGLLIVAIVVVLPILAVLGLSLFRVELGHDNHRPFVLFRNYAVRLSEDREFLASLPRTVGFALASTAVAVPFGLAAALLIRGASARTAGFLMLLLLIPWAVAPIAVGLFARLVFGGGGIANQMLDALGLPVVVLSGAPGVLAGTLAGLTWRSIPLLGILFLAALRQVPPDLERAARVDGAGRVQVFRFITLPAIAPMAIVAIGLQLVLALQVFDMQFAIGQYRGVPDDSVLAAYAIFQVVIGDIALGYGAAQTVVLGCVIALVLSAVYWILVAHRRSSRLAPVGPEEPEPLRLATAGRVTWRRPPLPAAIVRPVARAGAWRRRALAVTWVAARTLALVSLTAVVLGPIAWIAIASTQLPSALEATPPRLSLRLNLLPYQTVLADSRFQAAVFVTTVVSVAATLIAIAIAALAAYPLARYRVRGARPLLLALLTTQLIPPIALAIPVLLLFYNVGLRNTVAGLILVNVAFWTPALVWLLHAAFSGVPPNLERAARIDGSGRIGAIFRVVLPAAGPAVIAAGSIVLVGIWNDFVFAATLGGRDTFTLGRYLGASETASYTRLAATMVLVVAPALLVVTLLRRRILRLL